MLRPPPSSTTQSSRASCSTDVELAPTQHTSVGHSLQARAFLHASEDVDIDEETIDDILDGFSDVSGVDKSEEDASAGDGGKYSDEEDDTDATEEEVNELDISALYLADREAQSASTWSTEEVKRMMHHLKECGKTSFIHKYVDTRNIPIPKILEAFGINLCKELREKRPKTLLYFLRVAMSRELSQRDRLPHYNTIPDAVNLILDSGRILILTGAGISVSCGIPDFRSRNGLYASLKEKGDYELDDPQQMFDLNYFRENPSVFYSFASQIYPSNFTPSSCHRFIKLVENKGKLLRNYTQNIDNLERLAGVRQLLQCHGSFATASCLQCRRRVPGSSIESEILRQKVPLCSICNPAAPSSSKKKGKRKSRKMEWDSDEEDESDGPDYPPGIMKPDITFFGEKLTNEFDRLLLEDRERVDLLLIIGTSLKVSPVAEMLSYLPHSVPQILINKTPIKHINPDIVLLGNADEIVEHLCQKLEWELPPPPPTTSTSTRIQLPRGNVKKRKSYLVQEPRRVGNSHIWLFEGAEGGKWVREVEQTYEQTVSPSPSTTLEDPVPAMKGAAHRELKKPRMK